jgi:hypothetical protein
MNAFSTLLSNPVVKSFVTVVGAALLAAIDGYVQHPPAGVTATLTPTEGIIFGAAAALIHNLISQATFVKQPPAPFAAAVAPAAVVAQAPHWLADFVPPPAVRPPSSSVTRRNP